MQRKEIIKQYQDRYNAEIQSGSTIEINHHIPYIAIDFSNGDEYFFQGEEASNLLDDVPDWINEEVYLMAIAQNW